MTWFSGVELRAVYDLGHEIGDDHFEGTAAVSAYIMEAMRKHFARLDDETFKRLFYISRASRRGHDDYLTNTKPSVRLTKNRHAMTVTLLVHNPVSNWPMLKLIFRYAYPLHDDASEGHPVRLMKTNHPERDHSYYEYVHQSGDFDLLLRKAAEQIVFEMEVDLLSRQVSLQTLMERYDEENNAMIRTGQAISQMRIPRSPQP